MATASLSPQPPLSAATLAPPSDNSRPTSAGSNRSNSSRRGRPRNGGSSNGSRSGSAVSRGPSESNRSTSGSKPLSGGTSLGVKPDGDSKPRKKKNGNKSGATTPREEGAKDDPKKAKQAKGGRPAPIAIPGSTPAGRKSSQSTEKAPTVESSQSAPAPRSLKAVLSPPRSAMDAARDAVKQERSESKGSADIARPASSDILSNLQKMISDLKTLPPSSAPPPIGSEGSSLAGSRSVSGRDGKDSSKSPPPSSSPLSGAVNSNKLKADAPTFTPSKPTASPMSISPVDPSSLPRLVSNQSRSMSMSSEQARRQSSSSYDSFNPFAYKASPQGSFPSALQHFPLVNSGSYDNPLGGLTETDEYHPEGYGDQYQQLVAAQQIQYQQIQLLQAQISANALAQQQAAQQQYQMGLAPRFRALAEQRQAHVNQAQIAALAQAQQVYEMQQQALLAVEDARQRAAQATLRNPPNVFEEDDEADRIAGFRMEGVPARNGREPLNPGFSFGAQRRASVEQREVSQSQIRVDRSQGIGGAEATGLAGLAARAHRRTGSELTPAMQQQLELQAQIEALQAKQKALMQEEAAASRHGPTLSQMDQFVKPSAQLRGHRRVQSSAMSSTGGDAFTSYDEASLLEQMQMRPSRVTNDMPPPPIPTSHSRRHSVNVFAKGAGAGSGFGAGEDIPEDGMPPAGAGHHRSGSRGGFESGNWRSMSQSGPGNGNGSGIQGQGQVTDLASAQAQLQSLAQFRAAAGGGHNRMASFALPNMLPNLLAATTLSSPGGTNLWQQQQAFQLQLQQNASGPQRKSLFAPYLPQASLPPLLQAGKLVVGILRVNKKNRSDAYVATDVLEADIYICGSKDRNRALEGDIVAIELLDVDEVWNTKKDKEEKKKRKEENSVWDLKPADRKKIEKKKDDVEVEGQGLMLTEEELVDDVTKPQFAGHVVAVVERMPGQLFSGQLGVLRPSSAATKEKQDLERKERGDDRRRDEPESRPKIVWFKPTDKRVPLIAIPTEQAPEDFIEKSDQYGDRLFVATIKRWPITSLHPFGTLVEELGPIGDAEVETSALLKDCNIPTEEFPDQAIKCLPPLPWSIPEREFELRKDLREDRIFTIDPSNAEDLDDAISIKKNSDGTSTVGVHIADVSYFVKPNTALDREARKRGISVDLVQRAVPMLPPQLSQELCSLQPGVDRLAFSATFQIDQEGKVTERNFARTIVKSCGKLSYTAAQKVTSGQGLPTDTKIHAQDSKTIEGDLRDLYEIASKLRARRLEAGAMTSDRKIRVSFTLGEKKEPVDVSDYERTDAHIIVEEFMLLTNISVAHIIACSLPEQALLRKHDAPAERRVEGFVKRARRLGYEMDGSSAAALQKSFEGVTDAEAELCLDLLKKKAMTPSRYFCSGMLDIAKYGHWALNAPLYTHFTSSIRRYADVIVHRMLDACISSPNMQEVKFLMDRDQVAKIAQQCNIKKAGAQLAEEQSIHLHLCMLIHDLTTKYGPVIREGRVTGVLESAFDVIIPEFGIEKRVHADKMPLDNAVYDEHRDQLSLYWTNQDILPFLIETSDDPSILSIARQALSTSKSSPPNAVKNDSKQYTKSASRTAPAYQGLRSTGNAQHRIQDVRELMTIPVVVMADMTKSPPVLMIYACNPYAA